MAESLIDKIKRFFTGKKQKSQKQEIDCQYHAVLPTDKELYAELYRTEDMRRCSVCSAPFASSSNRAIYCPDCRKRITRRQTAERMRKMRGKVTR